MRRFENKRGIAKTVLQKRRGFTLIELIAVIAIIAITAAVAIPSLGGTKNELKQTELDAVARQIFVAAQNKSTAMVALGSFEEFDAKYSAQKAKDLPTELSNQQDYHYAGHTYMDTKDFLELLPTGSIDYTVLTNQYFIEYNCKTGDVYGVFYAEDGFAYEAAADKRDSKPRKTADGVMFGYFGGAEGSGYQALRTKAPLFKLINDEELCAVFKAPEAGASYTLSVTDANAVKAETYYFRFSIAEGGSAEDYVSAETSGGAKLRLTMKKDVNGDVYIILDSLDESGDAGRFKENFTNKNVGGGSKPLIPPGHDIRVGARAQKDADEINKILYLESDETSFVCSSLFDSVEREKGVNEKLSLRCFRHLQNMDAASGYAPASKTDGGTGLFEARLTGSVDWKDDLKDKASPNAKRPDGLSAISNSTLLSFDGQGNSISNAPLGVNKNGDDGDKTAGLFGTFTARENGEIKRLRLVDPSFKTDAKLSDALYPSCFGLLAGKVEGEGGARGRADITDCGVYATVVSQKANPDCKAELPGSVQYAGGLIGYMNGGRLTDCFAAVPSIVIDGEDTALARRIGGLVGAEKDAELLRCYANIGELKLRYGASGDLTGGFIGLAEGGKANACYTLGKLTFEKAAKDMQISGFANAKSEPYFGSCYTALCYGEELYMPEYVNPPEDGGTENANKGAKVFAFSDLKTAEQRYCFYLKTDGINEFYAYDGSLVYLFGEGKSFDELASDEFINALQNTNWKRAEEKNSHPYTADKLSGAYPFPLLNNAAPETGGTTPYPLAHYGDWPERTGKKLLVYYELYDGGGYGFYAKDVIGSLDNDKQVLWDGYAVLCEQGEDAPVLAYTTEKGRRSVILQSKAAIASHAAPGSVTIEGEARQYAVYPFSAAVMDESIALKQAENNGQTAKEGYYHTFVCSGFQLFANPNFAKHALNGRAALSPSVNGQQADDPSPIVIRTARQLYKLSQDRQSVYWDRSFEQERSIDFGVYSYAEFVPVGSVFASQPIGRKLASGIVPFTGIYDGKEKVISGLSVAKGGQSGYDDDYAGMFGLCSGTGRLWNIRLQNPRVEDGGRYAGLLAGSLSGQTGRDEDGGSTAYMAKNCYIYAKHSVEVVSGTYTFDGKCELLSPAHYIGGFAGALDGCNIYGCLVSPTLIEARYGCICTGGFTAILGETSASVSVERCYANTKLYKSFGADAGGFACTTGTGAKLDGAYALGELTRAYPPGATDKQRDTEPTTAGFTVSNSGRLANCYSLCTYNQKNNETDNIHSIRGYGFAKENKSGGNISSCYYMTTDGLLYSYPRLAEEQSYAEMMELTKTGAEKLSNIYYSSSAGKTYPYSLSPGYPFAFLLSGFVSADDKNILPHYGDWPLALGGTYLAYYEKYSSDGVISYGYWTPSYKTLDNVISEHSGQKKIIADGYAILTTEAISSVKYGRGNGEEIKLTDNDGLPLDLSDSSQVELEKGGAVIGGRSYNVYRFLPGSDIMKLGGLGDSDNESKKLLRMAERKKIDTSVQNNSVNNMYYSFYYKVDIDGEVFYFNPCFAKTVVYSIVNEPTLVSLRTGRQLLRLSEGRWDKRYWGYRCLKANDLGSPPEKISELFTVIQEHDIQADSLKAPIGELNNQKYYRNSFNGNCYSISASFSISGNQSVGLFGYNTGTLENIVFISEEGTAHTISGSTDIGALVGTNAGMIKNCLVAGFSVQGGGATGGFVGTNTGTISNCAAVNLSSGGSGGGVGGSSSVGGFAGQCASGGSIYNCYAVASNTASTNLDQQKGFAGGNSGSISSCYCAVSNQSGAYLDFGGGGDNCYAYTKGEAVSAAYIKDKLKWESADEGHSHPFDSSLTGACPWPTSVKDAGGRAVYYGNWIK